MINVVFTTEPVPFNDTPDQPSDLRLQLRQIAIWVSPLPESRMVNGRVMVQGLVSSEDAITQIEATLNQLGLSPVIIGVWDSSTGLRWGQTYGEPDPETGERPVEGSPVYPLNITEYAEFLNDVVDQTDPNTGAVTASHRPTEAEAQSIQVNRFAGMPDRDLSV